MVAYVAAAALIFVWVADTADSAPAGPWRGRRMPWRPGGYYSSTELAADTEPADDEMRTDSGFSEEAKDAAVSSVARPPDGFAAGEEVAVAGDDDPTAVWATVDATGSEHVHDVAAYALYQVEGCDYDGTAAGCELTPDSSWAYADDWPSGEREAARESYDVDSLSHRLLEHILRSAKEWAAEQATPTSVVPATEKTPVVDAAPAVSHQRDRRAFLN